MTGQWIMITALAILMAVVVVGVWCFIAWEDEQARRDAER